MRATSSHRREDLAHLFSKSSLAQPCDRITFIDGGQAYVSVVERTSPLRREEFDTQALFARDGPRRLLLVTCGGEIDAESGHYHDSVVVVATQT